MISIRWVFVFWALFVNFVSGKRISGEFTIGKTDERLMRYLTKFGCGKGKCSYKIKFRLKNAVERVSQINSADASPDDDTIDFVYGVFLDDDWEKYLLKADTSNLCKYAASMRSKRTAALPTPRKSAKRGAWTKWYDGSFSQRVRPHVWYFVVEDCGSRVTDSLFQQSIKGPVTVEWEGEFRQEGSHLPYELAGDTSSSIVHLVAMSILIATIIPKIRTQLTSTGRIHPLVQFLMVCSGLQVFSIILHLFYIWILSMTGRFIWVVDTVAELCSMASQIIIGGMLISISFGYTIDTPRKIQSQETLVKACVMTGITHLCLVVGDKYTHDWRYDFYAGEGKSGLFFAGLRLLLFAAFCYGCVETISTKAGASPAVRDFMRRFLFAGSLYFLAYPVVQIIVPVCASYARQRVFTNSIFFFQLVSLFWLSRLFTCRGEFFSISSLSQSFLPGGYISAKTGRVD
eukprot:GHVP01052802.1.p1 GENE.GHVP01052802.1~~GHVP01052802.1.p1  ORF type:complete len:459 (+),score=37.44 GHVP01052802.1:476-1852(+)